MANRDKFYCSEEANELTKSIFTSPSFHAEELIKKAVISEKIQGKPLVLHSDNGSPMNAATFQTLLEKLGIQSSYSRPRVSNDNPYSEAMFRTMKYRPEFPYKGFEGLPVAREWTGKFVHWYNCEHQHSGLKFVTLNKFIQVFI
jgi:putative transposase